MTELTKLDRGVILALLFAVPVLWERSIAVFRCDPDPDFENTTRRLTQLCKLGLLSRHVAWAQVAADVALFYAWSPLMPKPDFGARGWALAKLWERLEPQRTVFYTATDLAAKHFGRAVRNPLKVTALSHNIGLGQLFVHYAVSYPLLAAGWVCEDVIAGARGPGEKVVDAAIVNSNATPALAIEFAGASYAASNGQRLKEIHLDCSERNPPLPYEIWTVCDGGIQ